MDHSIKPKNIVILNDDFTIRLVLKKLIHQFFNPNVKVFTSSNGVQGLGYIFVVKADVVIVDASLPKHNGLDIIDYIKSNEKLKREKTRIIVLGEGENVSKFPDEYKYVNTLDENFPLNLIKQLQSDLSEYKVNRGTFSSLLSSLGKKTIKFANKSNRLINDKLFKWVFYQALTSFSLSLLYIFEAETRDENVTQGRFDIEASNRRALPTIVLTMTAAILIGTQVVSAAGIVLVTFFFGITPVQATAKTWTGLGTDGTCGGAGTASNWSCSANWSPSGAPASGDTITFNGTGTANSTIDAGFQGTVGSLTIASGYTGAITVARTFTDSGTYSQADGTFNGGTLAMSNAGFTLTGGTFTATSGTMSVSGNITISGSPTFNANGGTITLNGGSATASQTLACNNVTFSKIAISRANWNGSASTVVVNSDCSLPLGANPTLALNPSTFDGNTSGNLTLNGTLSGTGTLTLTSGMGGVLNLNTGSAISGFTGFKGTGINVAGPTIDFSGYTSFNISGGNNTNSNLTVSSGSLSLPPTLGTVTVGAITMNGGTFAGGGATITDNGGFSLTAGSFTSTSANLSVAGNFSISGAPTFNANGGTITLSGSTSQTMACNSATFNKVAINRANGTSQPSVTINSDCTLPLGNNPTLVLNPSSFGTTYTNLILNGALTGTGTLALTSTQGGTLILNSTSSITGFSGISFLGGGLNIVGSTYDFSSYTTFNFNGGINNSDFTMATGSVSFPATGTFSVNNFSMSGGTFSGGGVTMTANGIFALSGGNFTSTSGNFNVTSNITISGTSTFAANAGTITLTGSNNGNQTMSCNNVTFNRVAINRGNGTAQPSVIINSDCTLPLGNNPTLTLNPSSFGTTYTNLVLNGTLTGTGTLAMTSNRGGSLVLNSTAAISGFSGITFTGGITVSGGNVDFSSYSTFNFSGGTNNSGLTVSSGSITLPASGTLSVTAITINGGTFSGGGVTMTTNGTYTLSSGTFTSTSGTLNLQSAISISGGVFNANGGTVSFTATNTTFSCNNIVFNKVIINPGPNYYQIYNSNCTLPVGDSPALSGANIQIYGELKGTGTLTYTNSNGAGLYLYAGSKLTGFSGLVIKDIAMGIGADFTSYSPFTISDGYSQTAGTVSFPASLSFNVFTFSLTGGTFNASSGNMNFTGPLTISGSAVFNANGGTMTINGTSSAQNWSCNNAVFNKVIINAPGENIIFASNCNIPLGNNPTVNTGATALDLAGNFSGTGTLTQGTTATLRLNAGATITGFTSIAAYAISVQGANIDLSAISSLTTTNTLQVSSGSVKLPTNSTIASTLTISGGTFTASSGTTTLGASLSITGSPVFNANGGVFNFTGTSASLACNNVAFNNVTLNNTGLLTIGSNCNLPLGNNPTITNGVTLSGTLTGTGTATFNAGTLTLATGSVLSGFSGLALSAFAPQITFDATTYSPFSTTGLITLAAGGTLKLPSGANVNSFSITGGTLTQTTGDLTVAGGITLSSGTLNAPTGILNVGGALAFSSTGAFNHDNGTVNFTGGAVTQSCNSKAFNLVTFNNTAAQIVSANCSFPLGNNPTVTNGINLSGTLSGTGTLTMTTGTLTLASGSVFSGFTGLTGTSNSLTMNGPSLNASAFTAFNVPGTLAISVGTLNIPAGATMGALTITGGAATASTGDVTVAGNVSITTGALTAPSGNLFIGGNFAHVSGTFTHNSGTVNFNGGTQVLSGIVTTFNNFTKILASAAPQTLTFPSAITETVVGTLTLNGYDTTNRLLLRSSSSPTQWKIDPQGATRNMLYVDVKDGNSINGTAIEMGGTGSLDSTNNTHFNFSDLTPNAPTSLGPSSVISGVYTTTNKPVFSFTLSDPNPLDTVQYRIQIDDSSDFSSPVVDYLSALTAQGSKSFTVGQAVGSGAYTTGSTGQSLATGSYYWRVKNIDNTAVNSAYSTANGGAIAFYIDSTPPNAFTPTLDVTSPTTNRRPTVTFNTTDNVAVDHYQVQVDSGSFSTQSSPYQVPSLGAGAHTITVRAFDTSNNTTDGVVNINVLINAPNNFTPTLNVTSPTNNTAPIVSFVTTDDAGIDHYDVKVDSGSFTTQTSPYQLPTLTQATHTITVRAYNINGLTTDGTVNVTIDTSAPNPFTPTLNVGAYTTNQTPTLTFFSNDNIAIDHYEVQIDSGSFTTQSSPLVLGTLAEGLHSFTVKAFDTAGNTRTGTVVSTTVDLTAPNAFTPTLDVTSPTNNTRPTVSFSTTDNFVIDHYLVKVDSGSFTTQVNPYQLPDLDPGDHVITVRAFDSAGNFRDATVNITVDESSPDAFSPTLNVGAYTNNATPTLSFSTTDNIGIDHYEVKVDGGFFGAQTSPYVLPTLSQNAHTITVRAFDTSGNFTDGSVNVTVDTTSPNSFSPSFTNGTITNDTTPRINFFTTDNAGGTGISHFELNIDGGSFTTQTSPYDLPAQLDGLHTVIVRAYDLAGNYKEASPLSITIDTVLPASFTPTLDVTSPTIDATPIVSFSTNDNTAIAAYHVKVDGGSFTTQTSPYQLPILAEGSHSIVVRAFDTAGNYIDGTVNVVVDNTPPAAFTPTLNVTSPTNNAAPVLTFGTADDNGINHYEVKIDSGSFTTQTSPYQLPTLSQTSYVQSPHTITVRAFDNTGLTTDESINLQVDTTVPLINYSAPRKIYNNNITTTTVSFSDNLGIDISKVSATGGTINCTQIQSYAINCTSVISVSGTLSLHATDSAGNSNSVDITGYIIEDIPPVITINAPSKVTNHTITDTTIRVTDNVGILTSGVTAVSGGIIDCSQTTATQVDCTSSIADSGDLVINALDQANNPAALTEIGYSISTTPPEVFTPTLNTTPFTSNTAPILFFSTTDSDGIDHYEVQIDNGSFTRQISPYQMPVSSSGLYRVTVRAFDTLGNFRDGVINITIDNIAPNAFTPTLNVTSPTSNTAPIVSFLTTDNIGIDHYEVQIDAGSFSTQTSPYQLPDLAEGAHTITVKAFDAAGNTTNGSVNVTIDTTNPDAFSPTLNVTSPTNNRTPTLSFSANDANGINHYNVKIDNGSFSTKVSPYLLPSLTEGVHTIIVRAIDNAGNSTDGSVGVRIDLTAPAAFTPTLNVTSPTKNQTPILTFATTDDIAMSHFEVKLDSGLFTTQTSPYTLPTQLEGDHTILVKAFDTAGNSTQESLSFTEDLSGPADFTPTLNVTSPTNVTSPILSFSTTDNLGIDHYEVQIDTGSFATQTSPYTIPTLGEGSHTFIVKAFDKAGNSKDGSVDLIVDLTPPNPFTPVVNPGPLSNVQTPEVTYSTTDNVGVDHYEVQVDNGSFMEQPSPYTPPPLSEEYHSVTVVAFDAAGNSTNAEVGVKIDLSKPIINYQAPTKLKNSPIIDTTITVTDDIAIDAAGVTAVGGTLDCAQISVTEVDCTSIISASGTLTINATDKSGNLSSVDIPDYIVDQESPIITITAPTKNSTSTITDTTINITDNIGLNVSTVNATGGVIDCSQTSPTEVNCTASISDSGDLVINASDTAGNQSTKTEAGYKITHGVPAAFTPTLNTGFVTNNTKAIVSYSTTDPDGINHYDVKIDNGEFASQTSPYQLPELAEGFHTIVVRAFSNNGTFRDGSVSVIIDLTKPTSVSIELNTKSPTNSSRPTLIFSASDENGIDHYEVKVESVGGTFSTQTSPYTTDLLEDGSHVATVRAVDKAGNILEGLTNFVVDTVSPTGGVVINNEETLTTNKKVTLSLEATDDLSGVKEMLISESIDFSGASYEPFTKTKPWILSNNSGIKKVYVKFRDGAGNESTTYSDSIIYEIPGQEVSGALNNEVLKNEREVILRNLSDQLSTTGIVLTTAAIAFTQVAANPNILIFGIFILKDRKKRKPWGIVYDQSSKSPIPFAIVRLYSLETKKLIAEKVTDLHGRYGFIIDKGIYKLEVKHSDYKVYEETFEHKEDSQIIEKDIALGQMRSQKGNFKQTIREKLYVINSVLVYGGLIFSIVAFIINQNSITEAIILLYIAQIGIIALLNLGKKRNWGYVYDIKTGKKVKGAFVRLYSQKDFEQIEIVITDEQGRYFFSVEPGEYLISVSSDNYKFPAEKEEIHTYRVIKSITGQEFIKVSVLKNEPINLIIPIVPVKL